MKSVLFYLLLIAGLLAVAASEELVVDQFGVRARDAQPELEADPEKEKDSFFWLGMDEETVTNGLREARADNSLRGVIVETPAIVPLGRAQNVNGSGTSYQACNFVFRNMDKNQANWILYPYNFSYIEYPSSSSEPESDSMSGSVWKQDNQTLPDGALLSTMNTDGFPVHTYINWIKSKTDMDLKKAKVVYDLNVAILQVQVDRQDEDGEWNSIDLTYDSDDYCTAFYTALNPKYAKCFVGINDYKDWLKANPTQGDRPIVVYLSPADIAAGALQSSNGENLFGMLIVPDVMMAEVSFLKKTLAASNKKVQAFVNNGGVLLTTGKGAYISEAWGVLPDGTFDPRYTMESPNQTWQYSNGCDMAEPDESEDEFKRSTLCFSLPRWGGKAQVVNGIASCPLLSVPEKSHGLKKLLYFQSSDRLHRLMKHDEVSGVYQELDAGVNYPSVMYKTYGKGHIVVNMANPAYSSSFYQHIYNAFFLAGTRPIAVDNTLDGDFNRTIPALEQVTISVTLNVVNYFTADISAAKLYVYGINGTDVTAPSGCSVVTSGYPTAPSTIGVSKVFLCSVTPGKLSTHSYTFQVRIVDVLVTQQKKDVVILWPHLEYNDANRNNMPVKVSYGVKIQSAASALLRADMNIDPSSTYPLHCTGSYIDNVMNCENKEETFAYHVQHISIVPMVSPLIDILDQVYLSTALMLDKDYYEKKVNGQDRWLFPFPSEGGDKRKFDYLDWDLLLDRSDLLCADWDEGVKLFRDARTDLGLSKPRGIVPGDHIMNANYQTNNDDDTFLLKQFQFDDADKFYEHAVQRLMAFLDVTTYQGAKSYFGDTIPDEWRSASNSSLGKRHVLFVRHDIFWWKKYLMPFGLTDNDRNSYISLDRYKLNVGCGGADKRSNPGAFNNDEGLIPAEYPSKMELTKVSGDNCRTRIDLDDIETVTGGKIKKIHYIVPIRESDGKKAGDFYGFDATTGKNKEYPEVQFVYTFGLNVDIRPEDSRRGGEIVFTFDEKDLPWDDSRTAAANDYITVSADQIAVYKIYAQNKKELRIRFKRGQMPNEAYGRPSHLQIFFENTKWAAQGEGSVPRTVKMDVYEMRYDIGKPQQQFEDWSVKTVSGSDQTFTLRPAFNMPAIRLQFAINDDVEKSFMNPYELREPLIRYSMYEQELIAHRAVHGSAEFHPKTEPCIVTRNSGFSTFTHVGTSSVPFREYVSTGTSLQIPAGTETGRVEWDDIWGRHFVQNVRSTIFEYPPIPPPLRNFVMTTTFEILDKQGKRMLGGWRSNENVDVHVQMKLLNNYPKWFEVTACKENRVLQDCTVDGKKCGKARIYDTDNNFVYPTGNDDGTLYFKRGQNASYGVCFADGTVKLEGKTLTKAQMDGIIAMTLCAKNFNSDNHTCETAYPDLPVLKRTDGSVNGSDWNFATRVINYWPDGYIKENMWDLTHYDYDDNQFDKAYKYHMDNNLPHLGHSNTRPDNLISFPLYKGLGYSMVYDKTYSNKRYPSYKGWWSDNLQNMDHTLTAGNQKVNDVSVGKKSLIDDWFDITKLQNADKLVKSAEKNVYTCLFNRRTPKNYLKGTKVSELFNVYENNVVPVPIDFDNKMEFNYDCGRSEWYTPANISQYPNTVYTDTPRDWLYFASNLRGGALEDINVIYQLSPLASDAILFEGNTKVQDGGRFVYWNPANSKNSWLVVDNPVHIVQAKRNDIVLDQELIPTHTTTFDSVLFHHITVSDPEEIEREWETAIYTNNHGYGDFTVQIYVGDAGTTALPNPDGKDKKIRARLTFMNNAGFDINMRKNAINSTLVSQEAINSDDLMKGIVHALRVPNSYNFLQFEIPDDLKDYVKITPCPDVVGIAPLFFDFDSINVVTIRDGWKADYYVDIVISKDFPEEKRGRMLEIPIKLVKSYFDRFPGAGDVTGVHDYDVEVPSIFFGVPYSKKNPLWAGKVFYTSGYATNVDLRASLSKPYIAEDAILVSEEELMLYRLCVGREVDPNQTAQEGEFQCLDRLWNEHLKDHRKCPFTVVEDSGTRQRVSFLPCMAVNAPTFPVKVDPTQGPDEAVMHVLLRTHAHQVKSGYPKASESVTCSYKDWMSKNMNSPSMPSTTVHAKGAWIKLKWSVSLLSTSGMVLDDPLISPNNSGLAQVTITLENTGDYYAYNVMFNLTLDANVTLATDSNTSGVDAGSPIPDGCNVGNDKGNTTFWCNVSAVLAPRSPKSYLFRVFYNPDTRDGAGPEAQAPLNMRVLATKSSASIDLTGTRGEKRVTQDLEGPHGVKYTKRVDDNMVVLTGRRSSGYGLTLTASHKLDKIRWYIWRAKLPSNNVWTTFAVTNDTKVKEDVFARFLELGGEKDGEVKVDYVVAVSRSKSNLTVNCSDEVAIVTQSNVYEWRVASSNLLLLLLLLPGLAIPVAGAAAVFATTKGVNKEPVRELGMAQKQKFVPQELVDDEPLHMAEVDQSLPPPPLPQRAAPVYEPPEPAPQVATPGKQYAIPTGPTYLRAGVPVNVVDN